MQAEDIKRLLHWEQPFLMIDSMDECVRGERVVTRKNVSANDPVVPESGMFPGVLLLEGMGQSAALLFRLSRGDVEVASPMLGFVRADLHGSVMPGQSVTFDVRSVKMTDRGGVFTGQARHGRTLLAEAELAFAVEGEPT